MNTPPITRPTPKVGDTLYSLNIGNAARHRPQVLEPVQVAKVGRKYFECGPPDYIHLPHMRTTYHLDDWREKTDYCRNSQLFASPQEWEDSQAASEIRDELRRAFDYSANCEKIPLAALREIRGIVATYMGLAAKG